MYMRRSNRVTLWVLIWITPIVSVVLRLCKRSLRWPVILRLWRWNRFISAWWFVLWNWYRFVVGRSAERNDLVLELTNLHWHLDITDDIKNFIKKIKKIISIIILFCKKDDFKILKKFFKIFLSYKERDISIKSSF